MASPALPPRSEIDPPPRYRLGVDVGGTHTDLVLLDAVSGALMVEKVASTPNNPALGVLDGVARLIAGGVKPADIAFFAHGTTITTNALLEMRGAKVGLLITKGFRAVQEVQNQARDENLFEYFYAKPRPIAPQSLTREIPERCDHAGKVLVPLDREAVRAAARALEQAGVESIAVSYLFGFANPAHEQETRALIGEELPGVHVSLSCEVLPRIREWPRLSTTLVNAYLEPVMVRYIAHLNQGLDELGVTTQQRFLMQSNGGVMPFTAAIAGGRTVHTLFSGPAAGAQASAYWAAQKPASHSGAHAREAEGMHGLVTLDMGGTSADIAFIEDDVPLETTESVIARRQVDVPALDMTTISAGGGSIAWVDGAGFLNVGPRSAGAEPGPACYGRGGSEPTVTDADLACGLLNPDYFLGGAQVLDADASRAALESRIADPLGMSMLEAAAGIRRIVDLRMADEVRVFAAKRGVDLTRFTLLPFGGAGAVHAAAVAAELGMRRILVPPRPGAFSALGLLCTDVVHDYIRSDLRPLAEVAPDHAEAIFAGLEARARDELVAEGIGAGEARFWRELDLRYTGQGYELRTPLDGLYDVRLTQEALAAARVRFDGRHAHIHGHAAKERPVEVVSYRVRVRVAVPKYQPREERAPDKPRPIVAAAKGARTVYFDVRKPIEATLYERDRLDVGIEVAGPAIVEQFDATTVIPPGWTARVDSYRNLILEQRA
jgi:N-methylhydantoinase A